MKQALQGVRVIEWGGGRMAAYAGKLLADFGADVILIQEPGTAREQTLYGSVSDCEQDVLRAFLDGTKRVQEIAVREDPEGFAALVADADILLLEQHIPELDKIGLEPEILSQRFPELVIVAMTLAGLTPLGRQLRHSDLVASAIGGIAWRTPARHPNHLDEPPLKIGGYQADYATGLVAASAALAGMQQRRRGARVLLYDVSAQAAMASFMRWEAAFALYGHPLAQPAKRTTFAGLVPCKDGYFAFQASEQHQWDGLKAIMGNPEWSQDPMFEVITDGVENWDQFEPGFIEWAKGHSKYEILQLAQARRVPVFPLNNVEELLQDPQQIFREFFRETGMNGPNGPIKMPGANVHLQATPAITDSGKAWVMSDGD